MAGNYRPVVVVSEEMEDLSYIAALREEANSGQPGWGHGEVSSQGLKWDISYAALMTEINSRRVDWGYGQDYLIGLREDDRQNRIYVAEFLRSRQPTPNPMDEPHC